MGQINKEHDTPLNISLIRILIYTMLTCKIDKKDAKIIQTYWSTLTFNQIIPKYIQLLLRKHELCKKTAWSINVVVAGEGMGQNIPQTNRVDKVENNDHVTQSN